MRWGGVWGVAAVLALSVVSTPANAALTEPTWAWFGEHDRTFAVHPGTEAPVEPGNRVAGDFDGDGAEDLLFSAARGILPRTYLVWWGGDRTMGGDASSGSMKDWYTAAVGDFDGDSNDDVLWRREGGADYVWWGGADRSAFGASSTRLEVGGAVALLLVGDYDGDGADDVLRTSFLPEAGDEVRWGGPRASFAENRVGVAVRKAYDDVRVGDFDGDGRSDLLWYASGEQVDFVWWGQDRSSFGVGRRVGPVNGTYRLLLADYDGDGADDVLWYAPGRGGDYLWPGTDRSSFGASRALAVRGDYTARTGDFDGDGAHDVLWADPRDGGGYVWWGREAAPGAFTSTPVRSALALPLVADHDGDAIDDVLWLPLDHAD